MQWSPSPGWLVEASAAALKLSTKGKQDNARGCHAIKHWTVPKYLFHHHSRATTTATRMASLASNGAELGAVPVVSQLNLQDEKQFHEKSQITAVATGLSEEATKASDANSDDAILDTAEEIATHLLPLRDDFEPALSFRSLFLASCLAAFQAAMSQIYSVPPALVPSCRLAVLRGSNLLT